MVEISRFKDVTFWYVFGRPERVAGRSGWLRSYIEGGFATYCINSEKNWLGKRGRRRKAIVSYKDDKF